MNHRLSLLLTGLLSVLFFIGCSALPKDSSSPAAAPEPAVVSSEVEAAGGQETVQPAQEPADSGEPEETAGEQGTEASSTAEPAKPPAEVKEPAGVTPVEEAPEKKPEAKKMPYQDGRYSGTGTGIAGPISVALIIKEGRIESIDITASQESSQQMAQVNQLIDAVLSSQSSSVDTVSGATGTSKGLLEAITNALIQAKTD